MDGDTQQAGAAKEVSELTRIEPAGADKPDIVELLDGALRVPRSCPAPGGVCFRLTAEHSLSHGPLARRIGALLAKNIPVTLDLSQVAAESLASRNSSDTPCALSSLSELLALRDMDIQDLSFCLRCDHSDIDSFASGENWFSGCRRIVRVCDEFMYAMLCGLQVTLSGGADHPAATESARKLWSRWIAAQSQAQNLALFLGDPPPRVAERLHSAHAGIAGPLVISVPYAGAQPVFEIDLSAFDKTTLWRPAGLCEQLVTVLDRLLDSIEWSDPDLARDAAARRQVVLQLSGLHRLAGRLGGKPSLRCDRLRRVLDGLRQGLLVASRRRFVLKQAAASHPDWVADISCPVTRDDVKRRLSVDHLRPNIVLATSPWDLVREPGQQPLLPLIADLDCLVWRLPGRGFAAASSLDRLQREIWAACCKGRR